MLLQDLEKYAKILSLPMEVKGRKVTLCDGTVRYTFFMRYGETDDSDLVWGNVIDPIHTIEYGHLWITLFLYLEQRVSEMTNFNY